jgi:hypothetical protein
MARAQWIALLKQLPRIVMFSFAIALSVLIIASVVFTVLGNVGRSFDVDRAIFSAAFLFSFVCFVVRNLIYKAKA